MPDSATLAAFLVAALTLVIMPGPAVLYIVARGVHQGRAAALVSALGIEVGTLIHVLAATLGLSALLLSSDLALTAVTYLGVQTLLERSGTPQLEPRAARSLGRIFRQGVVVEALNPKTALFFLAFLPQFVDSERGSVEWQILLLGMLFVAVAVCVDSLYGLLAGTLTGLLSGSRRFVTAQRYVGACVYVGLAATTALAASGL